MAMNKEQEEAADKKFENNALIDKRMSDVFDWSDDEAPVRDALWNHYMENDNKSTDKTASEMKKYLDMSDDDVRSDAEKLLKQ